MLTYLMVKVKENIPAALQEALSELRAGLERLLGDDLVEARLFGSRARGDAEPDSDVDVMVIIRNYSIEIDENIVRRASEVSLEHDLLIVPFVWSEEKRNYNRELNTLLYRNIMDEGMEF